MTRLKNLFFVCRDLARSRQFYEELGLPLIREGRRSLVFDLGGCELHLHEPLTADEEERYGKGDVTCFWTEDDPAMQEAPWGGRMRMVRDPDGRLLELAAPPV